MKRFFEYTFTLIFIGAVFFTVLCINNYNGKSISIATKETLLYFHFDPKTKLFTWNNEVYKVRKVKKKYTAKEGRIYRFTYSNVTVSMGETSRMVIITTDGQTKTYK